MTNIVSIYTITVIYRQKSSTSHYEVLLIMVNMIYINDVTANSDNTIAYY